MRWPSLPEPAWRKSTERSIPPAREFVLVQSAARVLPVFSAAQSARAERVLRALGIDVRTGARVTDVDSNGVAVDGERIAARTVFWAAGVAASPAAHWLGQAGDAAGRVAVDENLSVAGWPGVYAIGDTAASKGWGGMAVPGLAPAATQQGRHVAGVLRAAIEGRAAPAAFRYRHRGNLATVGRMAAVAELVGRISGAPQHGGSGGLPMCFSSREAGIRAVVVLNWLWAYLTYKRRTRLITGNDLDASMVLAVSRPHRQGHDVPKRSSDLTALPQRRP